MGFLVLVLKDKTTIYENCNSHMICETRKQARDVCMYVCMYVVEIKVGKTAAIVF